MGYRDYSTAKGHIVDATGHGDFATIQAAITAAVAGDTVFIRPGNYVEDITYKPGVNVTAFNGDGILENVFIKGSGVISSAGNYSISNVCIDMGSGINLQISGGNACNVSLNNCNFPGTGSTETLLLSNTNASTIVNLTNCILGQVTELGISTSSSFVGTCNLLSCFLTDSTSPGTPIFHDGGTLNIINSTLYIGVNVGAATLFAQSSTFNTSSLANMVIQGNSASSVITIDNCNIVGSTANVVISLGTGGAVANITNTSILATSAASAIDIVAACALNYAFIAFTGNTSNIAGAGTYTPLNTLI